VSAFAVLGVGGGIGAIASLLLVARNLIEGRPVRGWLVLATACLALFLTGLGLRAS
jgi:hypothetical protein